MGKAGSNSRYFTPEALGFLRELARNNNRPWFLQNKRRYEEAVQEPALRFIREMGPRLGKISRHIVSDARPFGGSLSRIYRDTRFSKDKSPYKTHLGIHFFYDDPGGGEHRPGFFFHVAPGESMVASGMWRPEPAALGKIRDAIVASPAKWGNVVGKGIEIGGESYARVPAGYDPDHRYAVDLRRKDFFASTPIADSILSSPSLGDRFEANCRKLDPLNRFLAGAIGIPW